MVKEELPQVRWRPPCIRGLCAIFVLCLVGLGVARLSIPRRPLVYRDANAFESKSAELQSTQARGLCGMAEEDTNYRCPELPYNVANVPDAATCCALCEQDSACGAWTWTASRTASGTWRVCVMKELRSGCQNRTEPARGVTSGLPHRSLGPQRDAAAARRGGRGSAASDALAHLPSPGERIGSLFCFSLLVPWGSDRALLEMQHRYRTGIFACDEHVIYSNATVLVARGVRATPLNSDLRTAKGRDFQSPANINVFMAVWWHVVESGRFLRHGWTVKVSPSAVFFPSRLRSILGRHADGPNGVYLNNCNRGLRGGLEVFSRRAVANWGAGASQCFRTFEAECGGPCPWREDEFIDLCLSRVLHVKRDSAYDVLVDERCDPSPGWARCADTSVVAFHPIEDIGAHTQCLLAEQL